MFRIQPQMPVGAYKTYTVTSPLSTHSRAGTCEEADCVNHATGWRTAVDESTDLGQQQARYVRSDSGRACTEYRDETGLTVFEFQPGQQCFTAHRIPLEREPFYVVRGGDWRGNPTGERRQHARADDWVDDFATHQDRLADRLGQG